MRFAIFLSLTLVASVYAADGDGSVNISGETKTWHNVILTLDGPEADETGKPNPFTHYQMDVVFAHESGKPSYKVPGYFAADGNAAESSASSGNKWRAHLSPDKPGKWTYEVEFKGGGKELAPFHGKIGDFEIEASNKTGRDLRARGRLQYVGERYLQFAGDGTRFLKAGPDAPETLLAYLDFDGTEALNPKKGPLKTWEPHVRDWREGNPTWKDGKGKGLIGALNYLASKGLNAFSFLTYNAGGDGDNVWPFVSRDETLRYDCSKLDQWGIVFDHATPQGLYLHFKLQETENDDNRRGQKDEAKTVETALDGGALGPERKLYLRELIARYGHHLALNWNLGEENTQSTDEARAMAEFILETDPYDHPIVVHTYPNQQDKVYPPLLGEGSVLTGASLQNGWSQVHQRTLKWVRESEKSEKPWVVANDEQGPANLGVPPDPGYQGFDGIAKPKEGAGKPYNWKDIRRETLWGNLMAGGAGVEYYFGYSLPENDLLCQDFRSRDKSWDACRIALDFFREQKIPFWEMQPRDQLVGNAKGESGKAWCLAKQGEVYLAYVPKGQELPDLGKPEMSKAIFNPATGKKEDLDSSQDRLLLIRSTSP